MKLFVPLVVVVLLRSIAFEWSSLLLGLVQSPSFNYLEFVRLISDLLQSLFFSSIIAARTAFEKMTDVDYQGETYYTIRNLSLYECQGWCREEVECQAASFSFVANGLGQQETVCLLQNGTQANNPTSKPIRARNQYYMVKMSIRSGELQMNILSCILTFMKSLIYQPV